MTLRSSIPHAKTDFSQNQIASRSVIPWHKYTLASFFETRLAFRRVWVKEPRHSENIKVEICYLDCRARSFGVQQSAPGQEFASHTRIPGFPSPRHIACALELGLLHVVQLPSESIVACPCESDPPCDLRHNVSDCDDKTAHAQTCVVFLYLCPTISMTNGEIWSVWFGVCSRMISIFLSKTVRPAASKIIIMTAIIFARTSADLNTMLAASTHNIPRTGLRTHVSGVNLTPFSPRPFST